MKNFPIIFTAAITFLFASCSKPVSNPVPGNDGQNQVETKIDLLTNGSWTSNVENPSFKTSDQLIFLNNGGGSRKIDLYISASRQLSEFSINWQLTNNQNTLKITQTRTKINGYSNPAAPETISYKIVSLSSSILKVNKINANGSIDQQVIVFTKNGASLNPTGTTSQTLNILSGGNWVYSKKDFSGNFLKAIHMTLLPSGIGSRRVNEIVNNSQQIKEYSFSWNMENNETYLVLNERLTKVDYNYVTNNSVLIRYKVVELSNNSFKIRRVYANGSLSNEIESYIR